MTAPSCSGVSARLVLSRHRIRRWGRLVAPAAALLAGEARAAVIPAELVARATDVPLGATEAVSTINPPFALTDGTVAFTGTLASSDGYVFVDDQVVWLNSDEVMMVLTGGELAMGASALGGYVYSPLVDGTDSIWTHNGLLALVGGQAAVLPAGVTNTALLRPSMIADGTAYWLAGISLSGGVSADERVLYRSALAMPGDEQVVLATGDMVSGLVIDSPFGVDTDYYVSANGMHLIAVLNMDTGSTLDDGHIYVDGALLHQEDTPNGFGDNWDNFDAVTINDSGTYAFTGDTNGFATSDEFIAVNGAIVVREGDIVAGVGLGSLAVVRFVSLAENDRLAYGWSYVNGAGATVESVFFACNGADVPNSSQVVLTTGADELDLDGDGMGDALVADLLAVNTSASDVLTDDGDIYLELTLDQGGMQLEAMVRVPVSCCGNGTLDDGEQCDDGNADDTDACPTTCMDAFCGDGFPWAGMEECDDGNLADTDGCLVGCIAATCGDGIIWAGVEECDDGNGDDTDQCPGNCMVASCGDGYTYAAMEDCDDANMDETDACLNNCQAASCGDGIVWAGVEECDDGNGDDTDDCPGSCLMATCGDGFVLAGVEECDDGNAEDGDGCESDCTATPGTSESSGGDESSSGGDSATGTTGDGTSGTGGVDESGGGTGGSSGDASLSATGGSTGDGSTGDTTPGPFPGLDDDGGCACRTDGGSGRGTGWSMLLVLGTLRRRRPRAPRASARSA